MKTVIRRGAFETNSSSMHSICIRKETGQYTPEEMMCGVYIGKSGKVFISLYDLCFGRGFEILCTFIDKCRFAIASLNDDTYVSKVATKYLPGFKMFVLPKTWAEDENGISYKITDYGDIDHQSVGLLQRFLEKYDVSLEDFLTRREYFVVIDGDEYCVFDKMTDMGIVANIEDRYRGGL